MSHVTCHLSFFYVKKIGQSGGASRWRVCYQRGLPRLVQSMASKIIFIALISLAFPALGTVWPWYSRGTPHALWPGRAWLQAVSAASQRGRWGGRAGSTWAQTGTAQLGWGVWPIWWGRSLDDVGVGEATRDFTKSDGHTHCSQYITLLFNQLNYREEGVAPAGHPQICATCEYAYLEVASRCHTFFPVVQLI